MHIDIKDIPLCITGITFDLVIFSDKGISEPLVIMERTKDRSQSSDPSFLYAKYITDIFHADAFLDFFQVIFFHKKIPFRFWF